MTHKSQRVFYGLVDMSSRVLANVVSHKCDRNLVASYCLCTAVTDRSVTSVENARLLFTHIVAVVGDDLFDRRQ